MQQHAQGRSYIEIARAAQASPSTITRWSQGQGVDPLAAARFARAFGRPVLEAFIAAGYLTGDEAGVRPDVQPPGAGALTTDQLLDELRARMVAAGMVGPSATGQAARPHTPDTPLDPAVADDVTQVDLSTSSGPAPDPMPRRQPRAR